ncbi:MAG TPA: VTT domain-containing protein [Deltaproteobacteria bacterium]|mgnify:CR=1 FL=1|jgi:uncharacterized membrane protein YdjX (TVP38/TMEM64 family)/Fe-S oxidoreductase|nr:VTT domain-containing protein [Deltaproteobacteria bacterium]
MKDRNEMPYHQALNEQISLVRTRCTDCGACVRECGFLARRGTPKQIALQLDPAIPATLNRSFECSLCGLCSAVCPKQLDVPGLFLQMRKEAYNRGFGEFAEHKPLLAYERIGTSRRFTFYGLPQGCRSVFFPGCSLSGTRPETVKKVFDALKENDPKIGIVLDCCMKPSHNLGREQILKAMFDEMRAFLVEHGVIEVLVACPNCFAMFSSMSGGLSVKTVYEELAEQGIPAGTVQGTVTVHDPCVIRDAGNMQQAVRDLIRKKGLAIMEMPHSGRTTLCCGQGGGVNLLDPEMAESWGTLRKKEAEGKRIVTYCAGCTQALNAHTPSSHLLDLLFDPEGTLAGRKKGSSGPITYLNRILLKRTFVCGHKGDFAVTRERTFLPEQKHGKKRRGKLLILLILLAAGILGVHLSGAAQYLQQDRLGELIASSGALAPAIYILIYTLAPVLFLPGLPITIAGGILFGPFWGVIYTIIGSTMGATLAFLTARYLARDWVAGKLTGPRWERLESEVEKHGWKMVAFTRLIPAFPFNLLNYAFGLTKVRLSHYVAATFVFMLPACIAFIVFSSSLPDLIRGSVSPAALLGIGLIAAVSMVPVIYRRIKGKKADRAGG